MSIVTDIRTRAEEAIDRTTTTFNGVVGELRNANVNDVTARARGIFSAVPTVDVQKLASTVEGYRKAAQEQVDELLHADPRVGRITDKVAGAVESYNKFALQQVEGAVNGLVDQARKDPRVGRVVETIEDKVVKPARARFVTVEHNLEDKQVVKADADAPVQVKATPATIAKPARKVPARKTTTVKATPTA